MRLGPARADAARLRGETSNGERKGALGSAPCPCEPRCSAPATVRAHRERSQEEQLSATLTRRRRAPLRDALLHGVVASASGCACEWLRVRG
eukprot:2862980-Pleurochrysis_carterae.AAC.1